MPRLKTLANHGQFLLWAPAAPPLLAQKLSTLIVAVSHKHNRLPIPYRKGETVSCLSWGSFRKLDNPEGGGFVYVLGGLVSAPRPFQHIPQTIHQKAVIDFSGR
ncbi:hypothetical protein EMIT0P265_70364 [Pseudomonas zeae]